jgi:hypothetical protein
MSARAIVARPAVRARTGRGAIDERGGKLRRERLSAQDANKMRTMVPEMPHSEVKTEAKPQEKSEPYQRKRDIGPLCFVVCLTANVTPTVDYHAIKR